MAVGTWLQVVMGHPSPPFGCLHGTTRVSTCSSLGNTKVRRLESVRGSMAQPFKSSWSFKSGASGVTERFGGLDT